MSAVIMNWRESFAAGVEQCGGKGWNLARLHRYGFPVPVGFVISSALYNDVLKHANVAALIKSLRDLDATNAKAAAALERIHANMRQSALPPSFARDLNSALTHHALQDVPLAVRSSATHEDGATASFAGVHDSVLNVRGHAAIEDAILQCFASLWTLRAITYRRKMNISDDTIAAAIVIMKLVDAKAAGVAFSCDPATGREDLTVINANFGLGESVVSGTAEPDSYYVRSHRTQRLTKHPGRKNKITVPSPAGGTRLQHNTSDQPVLDDDAIVRLARLTQRVFYALGQAETHQDIEWAYDGDNFWLVQARPVTALPRWTCEGLRAQADIWSNGNFRDAVPMVLPMLNASFMLFHIDHILRGPFTEMGFPVPDGLRYMRLFQGRAYCNVALMQWMWFDATGFPPAGTNRSMGGHQAEISLDAEALGGIGKRLSRFGRGLRLLRLIGKYKKNATARFAQEADFAATLLNRNLSAISDRELAELYTEIDSRLETYAPAFIMLTAASGAFNILRDTLEKYFPDDTDTMANALLAGNAELTSANYGYQLLQLAECVADDPAAKAFFQRIPFEPASWALLPDDSAFKQGFKTLLAEQGHRAIYEIDLRNPRWREDPSYLLNIVKQNIGNNALARIRQTQADIARNAWTKVRAHVPLPLRWLIKRFVRQAASGAACKEMAKSVYIHLMWPLRAWALESGKRLHSRGLLEQREDIFHCADVEITTILKSEWNGEELAILVSERKGRHTELEQLTPPDVILGNQPRYSKANYRHGTGTLQGMGVASGCAEGPARVVRSPDQGVTIKPGDILVAPSTDPAWTPLFLYASAIVMETGGQLSHGAIVAREYGIPAVVNVPGLLDIIEEGDRLVVDGDCGAVKIHPAHHTDTQRP